MVGRFFGEGIIRGYLFFSFSLYNILFILVFIIFYLFFISCFEKHLIGINNKLSIYFRDKNEKINIFEGLKQNNKD